MARKPETIAFWVGRLPHWEVVEGRYFVTMRLAGALPEEGKLRVRRLSEELSRTNRELEAFERIQRNVFREMERWLDRAQTVTHLQNPEVAQSLTEAIAHRSQQGVWDMFEYVVMPNHIHLFFQILKGGLKDVMEGFKGWTGREACRILNLKGDRFWQREWFDHWSRSDEQDERIIRYIRENPEKADLVEAYLDWPYGSWNK